MSVFQGTGTNSSALADVISLFGAIGDYALENPPDYRIRVAYTAVGVAQLGGLATEELDAIYLAGILHGIGALGNGGVRKIDALPPRAAMMERWNIPAAGARMCERIAALPSQTADIVRWHNENWDGTGYPDQLRWHGIPKAAHYLHLAEAFCAGNDPEDALSNIMAYSGRLYAPELARTFIMWFHTTGGEPEPVDFPVKALAPERSSIEQVFQLISEAIDAHNGTPNRSDRIARRALAVAGIVGASPEETATTDIAARLFSIGEIKSEDLELHQFDPLASLGKELRATNAQAAAEVVSHTVTLSEVATVLRARAEWFDGTGLPARSRHEGIPLPARILSACIAHDALEESFRTQIRSDRSIPMDRMEQASGTQFDPHVIRALAESLKATPA